VISKKTQTSDFQKNSKKSVEISRNQWKSQKLPEITEITKNYWKSQKSSEITSDFQRFPMISVISSDFH
jgi:hypothetical protein